MTMFSIEVPEIARGQLVGFADTLCFSMTLINETNPISVFPPLSLGLRRPQTKLLPSERMQLWWTLLSSANLCFFGLGPVVHFSQSLSTVLHNASKLHSNFTLAAFIVCAKCA